MVDLLKNENADKQSGEKENRDQAEQINAPQGGNVIQFVLSDNIFRALTSVSIASWMIHEFVPDVHKAFLFFAIVIGLADAFYVVAHNILIKRGRVIACWMAFPCCIVLIFKNAAPPAQTAAGENVKVSSPAIPVNHTDYIEGTEYTQKRLEDIFPFGYAVFFFGQNRILRNEVFKNGLLDWKLDVDQVAIAPDFFTGQVTWTIPNVNTTPDGPGPKIIINGGTVSASVPLKKGCIRRTGFYLANKPVMHVMTLGDNQRTPVFVVGFRIPAEGEGRPPNPPYWFVQP
jgi:hypothetical protein